jgi:DNA-binding NarL/FixJ family response regulator
VLVDDQAQVRRGLRMLLALEPDLVVVGECASGSDVCPLLHQVHADIVVMDVCLADGDGVAVTARVHAEWPTLPVVMLSVRDDTGTRARAALAGATAFVSKHEPEPSLLSAIKNAVLIRGESRRQLL